MPRWLLDLLSRFPWLPLALIAVGVALLVVLAALSLVVGLVVGVAVLAALVVLALFLRRVQREHERAVGLSEAGHTPEAVDRLPKSPDFVLGKPGSTFTPRTGATDSPTAVRFKRIQTGPGT